MPPGPGSKPTVEAPTIVETMLDNGMSVVATQTSNVPMATMTVLFPGGSASDPRAKAGIAEMAAGLADKGTATMSAGEIAARLESLGASFSGTAASDGTYFSLTAPAATFEEAGMIFTEIVSSAILSRCRIPARTQTRFGRITGSAQRPRRSGALCCASR